jgi:hypothetical protein
VSDLILSRDASRNILAGEKWVHPTAHAHPQAVR